MYKSTSKSFSYLQSPACSLPFIDELLEMKNPDIILWEEKWFEEKTTEHKVLQWNADFECNIDKAVIHKSEVTFFWILFNQML